MKMNKLAHLNKIKLSIMLFFVLSAPVFSIINFGDTFYNSNELSELDAKASSEQVISGDDGDLSVYNLEHNINRISKVQSANGSSIHFHIDHSLLIDWFLLIPLLSIMIYSVLSLRYFIYSLRLVSLKIRLND